MGTGIFSIGLSGMNAAQLGMQVVQHNVANASTDGYNRQTTSQSTTIAMATGAGYFGTGTQVTTVKRQYDQFLSDQVNRAQTALSATQASSSQMDVVDQMLSDSSAGVSPAIQDFFTAAQQVTAYPSSIAARQSMVSAAQTLTTRINTMGQRISDLSGQADLQLKSDATALNSYAQQLVNLNIQINKASVSNQPPNDLLDQRDKVIAEMGKLANISTVTVTNNVDGKTNGYGSIQVYLGSGYLLVGDNKANTVEALPSSQDPTRLNLYVGGQEVEEGGITGGSLGGMLTFRSSVLDNAKSALGQVAYALASTFNAQNSTGMDMLGNQSGDSAFVGNFFDIPSTVSATADNSSAPELTASITPPTLTSDLSTGYYQTNLNKSNYSLHYDGTNYTLTRASDNHTWTGSSIADLNSALTDSSDSRYVGDQGFTLNLSGSVPTNTTYLLRPAAAFATDIGVNAQVAGDVRLVAAGLAVSANLPQTNQGSMTATVTRMTNGNPDPTVTESAPLTLTYSGGSLSGFFANGSSSVTMTALDGTKTTYTSDPVPYQAGAAYNVDGIVFSMTGVPAENDQIVLQRNDGDPVGVSDSSNMVLLGQLQSSKTIGGASTYTGSYAQLVADVGNQAAAYKSASDSQQSLLDMSVSNRDSYSGVNLDEEAANLLYYQQLYQANAKSLQAGQKIFDTLLSIMSS